ncbi:hypothetical protein EV421DRAFT_1900613 [Armillaria borealis]|uniref:Uncharacterized protein n=1 Tax=Armillaria borealis TaxID=47425 RepID=A0AA39JSZ1_9AGAR|nr:hypothetical protein EV421DRAFT_1900613 [Armillaria borealis]
MLWLLTPCKTRGGQEFSPYSLMLNPIVAEPIVAPSGFSLRSNLQDADDGDEGACEDEVRWYSESLRDEMGVDDEADHPINDVTGIDDIPNLVTLPIPKKRSLPPPGEYVPWDGETPKPIVDGDGTIFAVLAGQPHDQSYVAEAEETWDFVQVQGDAEYWEPSYQRPHRRGGFIAMNVRISYRKGQPEPMRLSLGKHEGLADRLCKHISVQWIACFGSALEPAACSATTVTTLMPYMPACRTSVEILNGLYFLAQRLTSDKAFGLYKHRDSLNCPFGWCTITALGRFNPKLGSHIILWELRMVVEFPHASTILIPSATVTHSNVPAAEGNLRMSFMQFCPGGLFRFVDNRFRTEEWLFNQDKQEFACIQKDKASRWEMGLGLLSNLTEILEKT